MQSTDLGQNLPSCAGIINGPLYHMHVFLIVTNCTFSAYQSHIIFFRYETIYIAFVKSQNLIK